MKTVILITAFLVAIALGLVTGDLQSHFNAFKSSNGRKYTSAKEESERFAIFTTNMLAAESMQAKNPHATFGVTPFADMSPAEFKAYHNGEAHFAAALAKAGTPFTAKLPKAGESIDWRKKGAVTYVKNQGQCGSCWAFSTTGNIEGQWFLAGNALTAVSEQELVSCDNIDSACNGGLMDNAFTWLKQNTGGKIATEAAYPYVSGSGLVPFCEKGKATGATITGYQDITKTEDAMADFVYSKGPAAIAVDATSWQMYSGGIMTNCISSQLDHGVLAVGFDDNNQPPYWIVKNSWGSSWGEQGYIRVEKGTGQCLIGNYVTTATVAKN